MRWYLVLILCVALIGTGGCFRVEAAPAPVGPPPKEISSEDLTNYGVVSTDGTLIGPVHGVVLDTETGGTRYVVVFLKDILNFGKGAMHPPQDHYLLIPWSHLKLDAANLELTVDVDAAFVDDAPVLVELPNTSTPDWDVTIQQYWAK